MRVLLVALLVCVAALLAGGCPGDDAVEARRRASEGGVTTPEQVAAVEAAIRSLRDEMGGILEATLAERMARYHTPGVQVAVVNGGVVEWAEAFGTYDQDAGSPMLRWSRLQAGSISKPTTALALLKLVEAGLVDLDAPLNDSLTSWRIPDNDFTEAEPVTLRRVLSHTAGINLSGFFGYAPPRPVPTLLQVLDGLAPATTDPIRVVQTPGSDWMYSGGAYTILAQVLEDVTGEPFEDWLLRYVLVPAGMYGSRFDQPLRDPRTFARIGTVLTAFPVVPVTHPELPAAGLWSTALDLGRLVVAIQRSLAGEPGALLGAPTAAGMITPQSPEPAPLELGFSPDPKMGLGLFLADGPDPDWFWHTGGNVGFTCVIVGDTRGLGFGAAVMTNNAPDGRLLAWEVVNAIADLYEWPGWDDWGI